MVGWPSPFGERRAWETGAAMLLLMAGVLAAGGCTEGGGAEERSGNRLLAERQVLSSCDTEPPAAESAGEPDAVEVVFWHGENDARGELLEDLVEEFDQANPRVTLHIEHFADGRDRVMQRWREAEPGERPSLALLSQDVTQLMADSLQTVAPGHCLAEAVPDVLPVIQASWTVDGLAQAVPFAVSTPVLFYNREMFEAAGLDPDNPPATLDELRAASQRIVDRGVASAGLVFSTAPSSGGSWFVNQWNAQAGELSLAPANGRGSAGHEVEVGAAWRDGPLREHLAWLQRMVADGLAVSLGQRSRSEDSFLPLFQDEAAMTLHTSAALMELRDLVGAPLGVAPLPGPGRGALPGGTALWLSAGKADRETQAAWRLAAFLASPEVQARWAAETAYVPITRSATTEAPLTSTWDACPQLSVPYRTLAAQGTSAIELGMSAGPQREIDRLLANAVDAIARGTDPAPVLSTAADDTDQLLAVYLASMSGRS